MHTQDLPPRVHHRHFYFRLGLVLCIALSTATSSADEVDRVRELRLQSKSKEALRVKRAAPISPTLACELGLSFHNAGQPARAHLLLQVCDRPRAPTTREETERAKRAAWRELRRGEFAPLTISAPAETEIRLPGFVSGLMIRPPVEIWLPQGSFKVNASRPGYRAVELPVAIDDRSRRSLVVELRPVNEPPIKPKAKTIEIEADPTQPGVVGTPKKIKHKSLLRAKWTRNVIRHREETAQHSSVSVRMLAGPALSAHSGSTPRSRSSTFGLQFRADGRYALSRRLAIGTGLSLLWAGEDSEGAQRSTQVAVPIALSAALLRGNHWRVEIESGFAARFGVAGRVGSDDIAAFDLAPSLGVSLRVKRFVVELHGEWGLLDIERGSGTSRRRSLAFLLGTEF